MIGAGGIVGPTWYSDPTFNGTRIEWSAPTNIALTPYLGTDITIARVPYASTLFSQLRSIDNEMDSTGADSGNPLPVDTLLYVYACTNVTDYTFKLAASTTAPTQVGADWYLGTTGETIYARFVGCTVLTGTGFRDDETYRGVWNQWNRIPKTVYACPNYTGDTATTTYVVNQANLSRLNGGTDDNVVFITGPTSGVLTGDVSILHLNAIIGSVPTAACTFAISSTAGGDNFCPAIVFPLGALAFTSGHTAKTFKSDALWILQTAYACVRTQATNLTVVADLEANGLAPEDMPATFLSGQVWC